MVSIITSLVTLGMKFFTKQKTIETDAKVANAEGQIEVTKVEIEKTKIHWRNALGFVLTAIVAYNWLIVPVLDACGIVLIQVPLGELLTVLHALVGIV